MRKVSQKSKKTSKGKSPALLANPKQKPKPPPPPTSKNYLQQFLQIQLPTHRNHFSPGPSASNTRHLSHVAPISTSTNLLTLRENIIQPLKSKRLVPKNTQTQFKSELLKQYSKKIREIVTIQVWWRYCRRKRKMRKYQNMVEEAMKREREKWVLAERLLKEVKQGGRNIREVIGELQKVAESKSQEKFSPISYNPEEISSIEVKSLEEPMVESKKNQENIIQVSKLQFKLYHCSESNAQTAIINQHSYSEQEIIRTIKCIYDQVLTQFCQQFLQNRVLFNRTFIRDPTQLDSSQFSLVNAQPQPVLFIIQSQHVKIISKCFFEYISKHYLEKFKQIMAQPYGFSPLSSLKSIRGALQQEQIQQMQSQQQTFPDQILLEINQQIGVKLLEIFADGNDENWDIAGTFANCILSCMIEYLSVLRPFGNNGKPPLSQKTHFPIRPISYYQQEVEREVQADFSVSIEPNKEKFMGRFVIGALKEIQAEWYDISAPKYQILYEIAVDLIQGAFLEAAYDIQMCFQ